MIKAGKAKKLFIALDADQYVLRALLEEAKKRDLEPIRVESMKELGKMCGIDIGTAVAVETEL